MIFGLKTVPLLTLFTLYSQEPIIIDGSGKVRGADEKPVKPKYTSPLINIDFHRADIHSVMRFFSKVGKTNIILDDSVKGTVTLRMENVHWEEAFLAVLWAKGLQAQSMDNLFLVK